MPVVEVGAVPSVRYQTAPPVGSTKANCGALGKLAQEAVDHSEVNKVAVAVTAPVLVTVTAAVAVAVEAGGDPRAEVRHRGPPRWPGAR